MRLTQSGLMLTQSGAVPFRHFLKRQFMLPPLPDPDDLQEISLTNGTRIIWGRADGGQRLPLNQVAGRSVVMHFTMAGMISLAVEGLGPSVDVRANQHTILYVGEGNLWLTPSRDQPCLFLQIRVDPGFFGQPLAQDGPVLHHLMKLVRASQPACLVPENLLVTPDMHTILAQITKCPLTCSLKRLFLEAKALELLALQLVQYEQYESGPEVKVPEPDYAKLVEVRRLLETHFDNPPTLTELSRLVGLNEFKLKKGFKATFGETIYNWVLNYRLDQAYQLLQGGQLSISEVAYRVGYQHPAHFSTAFKKKFSVVPSHLLASN